jgi:hypothetical protein
MSDPPIRFLTAQQLVERWGSAVCVGTLANWRTQGRGPVYVRIGSKVRYPIAQLEQWEEAQTVAPEK